MVAPSPRETGCGRVTGQLSDFLDGELDAAAASGVAIHLTVCAECARFAAELSATVDAIRAFARRQPGGSMPLH